MQSLRFIKIELISFIVGSILILIGCIKPTNINFLIVNIDNIQPDSYFFTIIVGIFFICLSIFLYKTEGSLKYSIGIIRWLSKTLKLAVQVISGLAGLAFLLFGLLTTNSSAQEGYEYINFFSLLIGIILLFSSSIFQQSLLIDTDKQIISPDPSTKVEQSIKSFLIDIINFFTKLLDFLWQVLKLVLIIGLLGLLLTGFGFLLLQTWKLLQSCINYLF